MFGHQRGKFTIISLSNLQFDFLLILELIHIKGFCGLSLTSWETNCAPGWCTLLVSGSKDFLLIDSWYSYLSRGMIERLKEIGFQYQAIDHDGAFKKCCRERKAFKEEFGHCNVPRRYVGNPSLGGWRPSNFEKVVSICSGNFEKVVSIWQILTHRCSTLDDQLKPHVWVDATAWG